MEKQKYVSWPGDAVADSRSFSQKSSLPHAVSASKGRIQKGLIAPDKEGFDEKVDGAWSSVTPKIVIFNLFGYCFLIDNHILY